MSLSVNAVMYDDFESSTINASKWVLLTNYNIGTSSVDQAVNGSRSGKMIGDAVAGNRQTFASTSALPWLGDNNITIVSYYMYGWTDIHSAINYMMTGVVPMRSNSIADEMGRTYIGRTTWCQGNHTWWDTATPHCISADQDSGRGDAEAKWVRVRVKLDNVNNHYSMRVGDTSINDITNISYAETGYADFIGWQTYKAGTWYLDDVEYWDFPRCGWDGCSESGGSPPSNITLSNYNYTNINIFSGENTDAWDRGGRINTTTSLISFTFDTSINSNCSCRETFNQSYQAMVVANVDYKLATTDTTSHSLTVNVDSIGTGYGTFHCACYDGTNQGKSTQLKFNYDSCTPPPINYNWTINGSQYCKMITPQNQGIGFINLSHGNTPGIRNVSFRAMITAKRIEYHSTTLYCKTFPCLNLTG